MPCANKVLFSFILFAATVSHAEDCSFRSHNNIYQLANTVAQGLLYTLSIPLASAGSLLQCDRLLTQSTLVEQDPKRTLVDIKPLNYRVVNVPPRHMLNCIQANLHIMGVIEAGSTKYAFSRKIIQLLNDPKIIAYLSDLEKALGKKTPPPLNLWEYTLSHPATKGDPAKVFEILGVLFADPIHQRHLGIIDNKQYRAQLKRLGEAIYAKSGTGEVEPYPKEIGAQKNQSLYHFYTIGYIAQEVKKRSGKPGMAFLVSNMANYRYETLLGVIKASNLDQNDSEDLYLGYAAALQAIGEKNRILSYEEHRSILREQPVYEYVKQASEIDGEKY